jgi:acetylxylan esterase
MKLVLLFPSLVFASPAILSNLQAAFNQTAAECAPVHLIIGRGSGEAAGEGATGRLSRSIKAAIPGATSEAVDYPAKLSPYPQSESAGTEAVRTQLTAYTQKCPKTKMVLMGYSQGADIVGSALCGGSLQGSKPISAEIGSHGK